jgi:hypothetical protein
MYIDETQINVLQLMLILVLILEFISKLVPRNQIINKPKIRTSWEEFIVKHLKF